VTLPAAALFGLSGAFTVVLVQAALADRHGALAAAALVEANALAVGLGVAAPLAIAVAIVAGGSWRAVFLLAALVPLPLLALAYRCTAFPDAPVLEHEEAPRLPAAYWFHWVALLMFVATEFSIFFWATDYLETERRYSSAAASALSGAFVLGMTLGRLGGGVLARRVHPSLLLVGALGVAAAGFVAFWLVGAAALSVVGLAIAGLGVALLYPLTLALALRASLGRTDAASARASFATGIAVAVAPFVLAALADSIGLRGAYVVVPVLLVAGSLALLAATRVTQPAAACPTRDPELADA
jgi:fucose permease